MHTAIPVTTVRTHNRPCKLTNNCNITTWIDRHSSASASTHIPTSCVLVSTSSTNRSKVHRGCTQGVSTPYVQDGGLLHAAYAGLQTPSYTGVLNGHGRLGHAAST